MELSERMKILSIGKLEKFRNISLKQRSYVDKTFSRGIATSITQRIGHGKENEE